MYFLSRYQKTFQNFYSYIFPDYSFSMWISLSRICITSLGHLGRHIRAKLEGRHLTCSINFQVLSLFRCLLVIIFCRLGLHIIGKEQKYMDWKQILQKNVQSIGSITAPKHPLHMMLLMVSLQEKRSIEATMVVIIERYVAAIDLL